MKKYINIIRTAIVFAAMAISASCIKVDIVVPAPEESQVSLTFKCSDIAQTRATEEAGEGTYNENDIKRLDIFFYALIIVVGCNKFIQLFLPVFLNWFPNTQLSIGFF